MSREKRIVEEGYDKIAEEYAAARSKLGRRDEKYLHLLLKGLPQGSRILDLGCGSGEPVTKLLAERHEVVGVDISRRQIQLSGMELLTEYCVGRSVSFDFLRKLPIAVQRILKRDFFGRMCDSLGTEGYLLTTVARCA